MKCSKDPHKRLPKCGNSAQMDVDAVDGCADVCKGVHECDIYAKKPAIPPFF